MISLAVVFFAVAAACALPRDEASHQQVLSYELFDGRGAPYGWRELSRTGCTDAALALLGAYAAANAARLTEAQRLELSFHSGQTLAFAGRENEALRHFEAAASSSAPNEWQTYVAATLAFLRHDPDAMDAARAAYARIAPGSMRLRIIDGFIACANEPYARAVHCRM